MRSKPNSGWLFWDYVIGPHTALADHEWRRRASITAGLSLILSLVTGVMNVIDLASGSFPDAFHLVGLVVAALCYLMSRSPWPQSGAILLIVSLVVLNFALLATTSDSELMARRTPFVLLPILLSTLILTVHLTIGLAALTVVGLFLLTFFAPWLNYRDVSLSMILTAIIAILSAVVVIVRERDLAAIRQQAESLGQYSKALEAEVDQRTRRIMATAEVGRAITGARDLDALLKQVVNLIVERFDFYHAQVFLVDETGRYAVLRESTGVVGQALLASGLRLEVGMQSVIGQVVALSKPIIVTDIKADPNHRREELLSHTRSEMALPLRVGGRAIGVLDIQSLNSNAFSESDIPVFQTMADQLAIAIENARLFEQAQRDLRDIELLNRQLTGRAWREYMERRSPLEPIGYRVDASGVQALTPGDLESELGNQQQDSLRLPLRVRGETVGILDVTSRTGELPDEETQKLLEEVAERVALALDSTRLGEQVQRQAEREQILSRISAELQALTDVDAILRVTVAETARAMRTPTGFVRLVSRYERTPSDQE